MDEERYINYKINLNNSYVIETNEYNGKIFYKITVTKTNSDGTVNSFKKQIRFVQCEPPKNGDRIIINKAFEDLYANNKDRFNAISCICIQDYTIDESPTKDEEIKLYAKGLTEDEEKFNFSEEFDNDLPF